MTGTVTGVDPFATRCELEQMLETMSGVEIAEKYGVSRVTVYKALKRNGLRVKVRKHHNPSYRPSPPRKELMRLIYGGRMTRGDLIDYYCVGPNTLNRWLEERSIPRWTHKERGKFTKLRNRAYGNRYDRTPHMKELYRKKLDEFWRDIALRHGYEGAV